jgi:REP-associated tyrosine transposase
VTKRFRENGAIEEVWQRNFYEHIIRDDESLSRIGEYIQNNPMQWVYDRENPAVIKLEPEVVWLR